MFIYVEKKRQSSKVMRIFVTMSIVKFRRSILIFFAALFVMHAGGKLFIYAEFYLNQEYIAENLCENKEKPELQCNGKCQLMKSLQEDEGDQPEEQKNTTKKVEYQLFADKVFEAETFEVELIVEESATGHCHYLEMFTNPLTESIFHPPIA